jgi:hypothetical protein
MKEQDLDAMVLMTVCSIATRPSAAKPHCREILQSGISFGPPNPPLRMIAYDDMQITK